MEDTVLYSYQDENYYIHHTKTIGADENTFRNHSHHMYEIYYFYSGEASFVVEGTSHALQRGTLVVTACGQAHHTVLRDGQAVYERAALLFSQKVLPEGFGSVISAIQNGVNVFQLDPPSQVWMEENLRLLEACGQAGDALPALRLVINAVFVKLSTLLPHAPSLPVSGDLVQLIIRYIHQNLTSDWDLDSLSKALFRSKPYLNQCFRRVMGCGIWEYTLQKRIFSAQQQLYFSHSISFAFQTSGFKDYSVFFKQYKKIIGLSPSEDLRSWESHHPKTAE